MQSLVDVVTYYIRLLLSETGTYSPEYSENILCTKYTSLHVAFSMFINCYLCD